MPGGSGSSAAALAQEILDPAVLERVKRHHGEPPAGREKPLSRGEAAVEFAQLVVDDDPQGLEGPGCWMLSGLRPGDCPTNDFCELESTLYRLAPARLGERTSDPSGKPLFAERADHPGEI